MGCNIVQMRMLRGRIYCSLASLVPRIFLTSTEPFLPVYAMLRSNGWSPEILAIEVTMRFVTVKRAWRIVELDRVDRVELWLTTWCSFG